MDSGLSLLATLLRQKDNATSKHCDRVMHYAVRVGTQVGVIGKALDTLRNAALLHDVGKIHVPDDILNYPGPLDATSLALVRTHALRGEEILRRFTDPHVQDIARIAGAHHEWFDGSGYPRGLRGENIPLAARIIAICDAFDAMTAGRQYQPPRSHDAAAEELMAFAGRQFDPRLVSAFVATLDVQTSRVEPTRGLLQR